MEIAMLEASLAAARRLRILVLRWQIRQARRRRKPMAPMEMAAMIPAERGWLWDSSCLGEREDSAGRVVLAKLGILGRVEVSVGVGERAKVERVVGFIV